MPASAVIVFVIGIVLIIVLGLVKGKL